jgi:hypothetical protein
LNLRATHGERLLEYVLQHGHHRAAVLLGSLFRLIRASGGAGIDYD